MDQEAIKQTGMWRISLLIAAGCLLLAGAATSLFLSPHVSADAISLSVERSHSSLDEAWRMPAAATYNRTVIEQSNGSRCGPASLANAFRSMGDEAVTEAKVLAGTGRCTLGICVFGLTLDQLADVARANSSRRITVLRNVTEQEFRERLRDSNNPARRYIINFDRKAIFGEGVGHFSPLGGYLEKNELAFVLDVNPDFGPWLIDASRLFAAMNTLDGDKKRGLLIIE